MVRKRNTHPERAYQDILVSSSSLLTPLPSTWQPVEGCSSPSTDPIVPERKRLPSRLILGSHPWSLWFWKGSRCWMPVSAWCRKRGSSFEKGICVHQVSTLGSPWVIRPWTVALLLCLLQCDAMDFINLWSWFKDMVCMTIHWSTEGSISQHWTRRGLLCPIESNLFCILLAPLWHASLL